MYYTKTREHSQEYRVGTMALAQGQRYGTGSEVWYQHRVRGMAPAQGRRYGTSTGPELAPHEVQYLSTVSTRLWRTPLTQSTLSYCRSQKAINSRSVEAATVGQPGEWSRDCLRRCLHQPLQLPARNLIVHRCQFDPDLPAIDSSLLTGPRFGDLIKAVQ